MIKLTEQDLAFFKEIGYKPNEDTQGPNLELVHKKTKIWVKFMSNGGIQDIVQEDMFEEYLRRKNYEYERSKQEINRKFFVKSEEFISFCKTLFPEIKMKKSKKEKKEMFYALLDQNNKFFVEVQTSENHLFEFCGYKEAMDFAHSVEQDTFFAWVEVLVPPVWDWGTSKIERPLHKAYRMLYRMQKYDSRKMLPIDDTKPEDMDQHGEYEEIDL